MKIHALFTLLFFFCLLAKLPAQTPGESETETRILFDQVKLKNKIVPLGNPGYRILDYYEASGEIGFLPQAKPYTKLVILKMLDGLG